jgi:hypothetical protein
VPGLPDSSGSASTPSQPNERFDLWLGALSEDHEQSRLLRFALTDAFNSGARVAAAAVVEQVAPEAPQLRPNAGIRTLHANLPGLVQEEVDKRALAG